MRGIVLESKLSIIFVWRQGRAQTTLCIFNELQMQNERLLIDVTVVRRVCPRLETECKHHTRDALL